MAAVAPGFSVRADPNAPPHPFPFRYRFFGARSPSAHHALVRPPRRWVWPASVAIIVAWVDAPNQGVAFSAQGLFWEGGGVIASVIYTAFFTDLWLWRLPFFIAASVCALAAAGVALLVTNKAEDMGMRPPMTAAALRVAAGTPPQTTVDAKKADAPAPPPPPPHPLDGTSSAHAISVMMGSVTYWIAFAASVSNGAVVYVIFYMPAWSMEALDAEPEHAAFLLVMCNLGGAVGLFIGGFLHDRLHSRGRSISNSIYGLTAAALLTVLPLLYGADTSGGLVSSPGLSIHTLQYMLLPIGYVVSVPYYINIVAFYADFGGRDHAATCSTFADVFMTIGAAATQELVGYFIGAQQYVEVLWLGAVMAWVYAICLLGFAAATYTHGYPLPPDVNSSGEHVRSA